ncbi:PAS domain-containing sensor histidine kinase [Spirosoma luteum]|uniref:PAS domain-containing sensor histidine kinase n=1 Tax=Spirosoma luteum TaxID=431553 RepID=UPI00036CE4A5|nr:PAS domain-containing sensor histidine kinase [Spirosoma luteum]
MSGDQRPFDSTSTLNQRLDIDLALLAAGLGVWEVNLITNQVLWDDRCRQLFGIDQNQISFSDTWQYIHSEDVERINQAVQWAMNPLSDGHYQATYRSIGQDGRTRWIQSTGRSYFDPAGQPVRFAGVAQEVTRQMEAQHQEVTQQVAARRKLEESEAKFRLLIEEAPFATALYTGPELTIDTVNMAMLQLWDKSASIVGKTFDEALPELESQPFTALLKNVYQSGVEYVARGQAADIMIDGRLQRGWYNFNYKPLCNQKGDVYGILHMAIEVTQQVMARQELEELQVHLQEAMELAQLGIWSIDVATNKLNFSDRLIEWFGYDPDEQDYQQVIPMLDAADQVRVNQAVAWALNPQSDGVYNEIYTVIHPGTAQKRVLHARGKTVFDAQGQAVRLNGTAQDITLHRSLQLTLEQQVQQRTEELAATNEALAATIDELETNNEEFAALNEELKEANQLLNRSNENLQQFAYVASHDLQEPLRKIQSFSDILRSQYESQLGDGVEHLQRMQLAASRMSTLIRDLLAYSRISTHPDSTVPVSLTTVIRTAVDDLDLLITETGATVLIDELPIISGDPVQLGQLFQNLLSNALKFRQTNTTPHIQVRCQLISSSSLPATIQPTRQATAYYLIEVADNGIGFDDKYTNRIFQVFQRLHSKTAYAGTGIGLAICEKVVANHGGAIGASSQLGQGATFSIYFPYR